MTKNSEWGAVAYLTHSKYGKNGVELAVNNVNVDGENTIKAVTGYSSGGIGFSEDKSRNLEILLSGSEGNWKTSKGQTASSTGNIYGIYDLSGGLGEFTAGYIEAGKYYEEFGGNLKGDSDPYKSKYEGTSNIYSDNYIQAVNAKRLGEGIWETSNTGSGSIAWNDDDARFCYISYPFFRRGGSYGDKSKAGIFAYSCNTGGSILNAGFRAILITE